MSNQPFLTRLRIFIEHFEKAPTTCVRIDEVIESTLQQVDTLCYSKSKILGVPSGFQSIDCNTYGWLPTDLIILSGRPAIGKTAFALNLVCNAALNKDKPTGVGFFSLDLKAERLTKRLLSIKSEVLLEKINRGVLEDNEYRQLHSKGVRCLEQAPIYIDDTVPLNIFEFKSKARQLVHKHDVGIIIIDYLQLMNGKSSRRNYHNQEEENTFILRHLKELAKELKVPIVVLSYLGRTLELRKKTERIPILSDLRATGVNDDDADIVMFLYELEYENPRYERPQSKVYIRIARNRRGFCDEIKLLFRWGIQQFEERDGDNY